MVEDIQSPFIIVGLGNPGLKYRSNRHNVGYMVLDKLADYLSVKFSRMEMKASSRKDQLQRTTPDSSQAAHIHEPLRPGSWGVSPILPYPFGSPLDCI